MSEYTFVIIMVLTFIRNIDCNENQLRQRSNLSKKKNFFLQICSNANFVKFRTHAQNLVLVTEGRECGVIMFGTKLSA